MNKIVYSVILVVGLAGMANAEERPQLSPEYAQLQEVIDEMTPEQLHDVLVQAKRIQAELERMPPEQQQRLYESSKRAVAEMDIGSIDTPKLNTKERVSVIKVDDRMGKLHARQ
jgi:hypothetical protein